MASMSSLISFIAVSFPPAAVCLFPRCLVLVVVSTPLPGFSRYRRSCPSSPWAPFLSLPDLRFDGFCVPLPAPQHSFRFRTRELCELEIFGVVDSVISAVLRFLRVLHCLQHCRFLAGGCDTRRTCCLRVRYAGFWAQGSSTPTHLLRP